MASAEYQRQWRRKNPNKVREYEKRRDPAKRLPQQAAINKRNRHKHKERNRRYQIAWQAANREKCSEYSKRWQAKNKARARATALRWQAANRELLRLYNHLYRARKRNAPGCHTTQQARARWDYYGGMCYMCGIPAQGFDHVIPLAKGGSNWAANLRPACKSCNSRKRCSR